MAQPFIHHLYIIHAQLYYTYIHIYNLGVYLQLKIVKSFKFLKANKTTLTHWRLDTFMDFFYVSLHTFGV